MTKYGVFCIYVSESFGYSLSAASIHSTRAVWLIVEQNVLDLQNTFTRIKVCIFNKYLLSSFLCLLQTHLVDIDKLKYTNSENPLIGYTEVFSYTDYMVFTGYPKLCFSPDNISVPFITNSRMRILFALSSTKNNSQNCCSATMIFSSDERTWPDCPSKTMVLLCNCSWNR